MKFSKTILAGLICGLCLSTACQAEVWSVTQGLHGSWKGSWTLTSVSPDGVKYFNCAMQSGEYILTAKARIIRMGNQVMAWQDSMSTGNTCAFIGIVDHNRVVGKEVCDVSGLTYDWTAEINPEQNK